MLHLPRLVLSHLGPPWSEKDNFNENTPGPDYIGLSVTVADGASTGPLTDEWYLPRPVPSSHSLLVYPPHPLLRLVEC